MKRNPLQFAITREDPTLEVELVQKFGLRNLLLVGSGGDTVFALRHAHPTLGLTVFDFNPIQLSHIRAKASSSPEALNREPEGLCQAGNFESLFRSWRKFFNEFVLSEADTRKAFAGTFDWMPVFAHPYWSVAFDLHFHDNFLRAMFGEAAIQHAPAGSYPRYFQRVFERGLAMKDSAANPFLQHIFLGSFSTLPDYLQGARSLAGVEFVTGTLFDVPDLTRFDLVQLSNIFDWSSLAEVRRSCEHLAANLRPGALVLLRQINNESPLVDLLGPTFEHLPDVSAALLARDRSLFYSNLIVARKR